MRCPSQQGRHIFAVPIKVDGEWDSCVRIFGNRLEIAFVRCSQNVLHRRVAGHQILGVTRDPVSPRNDRPNPDDDIKKERKVTFIFRSSISRANKLPLHFQPRNSQNPPHTTPHTPQREPECSVRTRTSVGKKVLERRRCVSDWWLASMGRGMAVTCSRCGHRRHQTSRTNPCDARRQLHRHTATPQPISPHCTRHAAQRQLN